MAERKVSTKKGHGKKVRARWRNPEGVEKKMKFYCEANATVQGAPRPPSAPHSPLNMRALRTSPLISVTSALIAHALAFRSPAPLTADAAIGLPTHLPSTIC